jgi:hypothetical protein
VGRRLMVLAVLVAAIALMFVGVAAATGGFVSGGEVDSTDVGPTESSDSTDTTDTTLGNDENGGPGDPPDQSIDEGTTETSETSETTESTEVDAPEKGGAPADFGQTISSMRAAGDNTPAAVVMGKKVPGYYKKMAKATETTATTEAPPAAD